MSIVDIRAAFNAVSQPTYSCRYAYHLYTRSAAGERQLLQFTGMDAAGEKFEIEAKDLPAGSNLLAIAAQTAQTLLDEGIPAP